MKKYVKQVEDNIIVFKNTLDHSELKVTSYKDKYTFDTIFIDYVKPLVAGHVL